MSNDRKRIAADVLEFAKYELLQDRPFTPGRQIAELAILGLYFKIVAGLESVITLVEKGLPTFAIVREMLEALISMKYIAKADSSREPNCTETTSTSCGGGVLRNKSALRV